MAPAGPNDIELSGDHSLEGHLCYAIDLVLVLTDFIGFQGRCGYLQHVSWAEYPVYVKTRHVRHHVPRWHPHNMSLFQGFHEAARPGLHSSGQRHKFNVVLKLQVNAMTILRAPKSARLELQTTKCCRECPKSTQAPLCKQN